MFSFKSKYKLLKCQKRNQNISILLITYIIETVIAIITQQSYKTLTPSKLRTHKIYAHKNPLGLLILFTVDWMIIMKNHTNFQNFWICFFQIV